jgi:WD40 repeat protein
MAVSPDGKRIAFTADGVRILDLATREEVWNAPVKSLQKAIWLGGDDRLVTASAVRITIWNVAKKTEVRSVAPTAGTFTALAASADAKVVVAAQSDGSLWIWNATSEDAPRVEKDVTVGAMTLALSPDGKLLAIALRGDRSLRVRDLATGKEQKWAGPTSTVMAMALSPDGKLLLTGSSNGLVSIWNAENGEASRDLTGHTSSVTWASFSLDGKSVVSGGLDALVRVSEVKAGAAPRELKGHRGRISAVYFTSDGGLISSGADGSVRLWPKP